MSTVPSDAAFADEYAYGLTKLEYFAAEAMKGLLAGRAELGLEALADMAVEQADALIDALNRKKQSSP